MLRAPHTPTPTNHLLLILFVQRRRAGPHQAAIEDVLDAVGSLYTHDSPCLRLVLLGKVSEDGQDVDVGDQSFL